MRLSLSTWNYLKPLGARADLRVALEQIRAAGFGAELWLDWTAGPRSLERSRWSELKELCSGLPALSAHSRLIEYFSLNTLYQEMDLCACVGADPLVCHPRTFGLDVSTWAPRGDLRLEREDRSRIGEILAAAAARSLRLALENGPLDLLAQILEGMAGHPAFDHLGICVDTGHANMHSRLYDSPALDFVRCFRSRLIHLHLHDNRGEEDDHLVPGQGTIDWSPLFEELVGGGYTGQIVFELALDRPEAAAERARNFVQAQLQRAGSVEAF